MSTALAPKDDNAAIIEQLAQGDLSKLTPQQRIHFYNARCERIGVDPLTQPFSYIVLNGKLTLYANKSCTDGLARVHSITRSITRKERIDDVYVVTAQASLPDGRHDESDGAVSIAGLKGESLANALMKAETKAKRRATLSLMGLGMLDESEIETVPTTAVETKPTNGATKPQTDCSDIIAYCHKLSMSVPAFMREHFPQYEQYVDVENRTLNLPYEHKAEVLKKLSELDRKFSGNAPVDDPNLITPDLEVIIRRKFTELGADDASVAATCSHLSQGRWTDFYGKPQAFGIRILSMLNSGTFITPEKATA